MVCKEVLGNIRDFDCRDRLMDYLCLEWYETSKRILRKRTNGNDDMIIKMLKEGNRLCEGDVLFEDEEKIVAVFILPCDAIEVTPRTMLEIGTICYEIGNRHLPLFIQDDRILVPYERPLEQLLTVTGYQVRKTHCKLLHMLKANVAPHGHRTGGSLLSKILDLTN